MANYKKTGMVKKPRNSYPQTKHFRELCTAAGVKPYKIYSAISKTEDKNTLRIKLYGLPINNPTLWTGLLELANELGCIKIKTIFGNPAYVPSFIAFFSPNWATKSKPNNQKNWCYAELPEPNIDKKQKKLKEGREILPTCDLHNLLPTQDEVIKTREFVKARNLLNINSTYGKFGSPHPLPDPVNLSFTESGNIKMEGLPKDLPPGIYSVKVENKEIKFPTIEDLSLWCQSSGRVSRPENWANKELFKLKAKYQELQKRARRCALEAQNYKNSSIGLNYLNDAIKDVLEF